MEGAGQLAGPARSPRPARAALRDAGVDIRGMQIFPGVHEVTDEVVVDAPDTWVQADVAVLVESRRVAARALHALHRRGA